MENKMEKQTITIGQVRLVQEDGWYIVEESPEKDKWQPIAQFRLGVDVINYLKDYLDEVVEQMKKPVPSVNDLNRLG